MNPQSRLFRILLALVLLLVPGGAWPLPLLAADSAAPPAAPAPSAASRASGASPGSAGARQASFHPSEVWFVTTIADKPVGSFREARSEEGSLIRTDLEMKLALNRMGSLTEMTTLAASRETRGGRLVSLDFELDLSSQTTVTRARIEDGIVRITSEAGGRSFERAVEYTGELIGPEAAARLSASGLARPGDRIEYRTFAAEIGAVAGVAREVKAVETIEAEGLPVESLKVEESVEGAPMKSLLWLDREGRVLRTELPGPFGVIRTYRAGREEAKLAEGGGELPGESYGASILRTQLRLPQARRISRMTLELRHRNPDLGWPDFEAPGQSVLSPSRESVVLSVERREPRSRPTLPLPASALERDRLYLEPNAYIQSDEPHLAEKAREIVGDERDLWKAAKKLERWVAENMQFDLGVVLAPSVEVFEKRRGTCVGYAMLLTTLARAAGIPARYVMGYVYVAGMFGGHAWTEVRVGEDWIALDGAVVADGPADAARFAFFWSALDEGVGRMSTGPGAKMYGQIELRVIDYSIDDGPSTRVAEAKEPWSVEGDLYHDAGLGLELTKPAAFSFTDLGKVWPEEVIVGLEGPEGQKASLRQARRRWFDDARAGAMKRLEEAVPGGKAREDRVGTRQAFVLESPGRAALALPDGGDLWLLTVEGQNAPAWLRTIAAGLRIPDGGGGC